MKKFEFNKSTIEIEIAGEKLKCDVTEAEIEMSAAWHNIVKFSNKVTQGMAQRKDITELIETTLEHIDAAFGEGSAKRVFKNRSVSVHDCSDVVMYINGALNEYEDKKKSLYESYNPKQGLKAVK